MVLGVEASPDKMLQGRIFAYSDARRYRVGPNHNLLPINRPRVEANNYQRDGAMRFDGNGGGSVYYEPNSFGGPKEVPEAKQTPFPVSGNAASVAYDHDDHYTQAGDLYRLMEKDERTRLVENIVGAMKPVERDDIKLKVIQNFYKAGPEYGQRIAKGLNLAIPQGVKSSSITRKKVVHSEQPSFYDPNLTCTFVEFPFISDLNQENRKHPAITMTLPPNSDQDILSPKKKKARMDVKIGLKFKKIPELVAPIF